MARKKRKIPNRKHPTTVVDKLRAWVNKNEDRWYTVATEDVVAESGVSKSTVQRYFYLLVARKAKITPEEVHRLRMESNGIHGRNRRLSKEEIEEIIRLHYEGNSEMDIAFITGRSPSVVAKYKPPDLKNTTFIRKRTLAEHKAANPEVFGHIGPDMTEEDIENAKKD